jgi:DNA-binding HxlR family transcriptional regulator
VSASLASSAAPSPCPLATALESIGSKWSLRVLFELAIAPQRFNELQRLNEGISHKVLTETLRRLERDGLISRSAGDGAVLSVEYALTGHGRSVRPVLDAMIAWGNQHLAEQDAMVQGRCSSS